MEPPPPYSAASKTQQNLPTYPVMPGYTPNVMPQYGQAQPTPILVGQSRPGPIGIANNGTGPIFGRSAVVMVCPYCYSPVTTTVDSKVSSLGLVLACICCFTGLWLCAWMPLVLGTFQEVRHRCPNCHVTLGVCSDEAMYRH